MAQYDPQTEHCLVRFNERWAPAEGTIAAHQTVLSDYGHVWVAKFGQGLSDLRIRGLQRQIDSGLVTFLVLLTGAGRRRETAMPRGAAFRLTQIQALRPRREDSASPSYYNSFPLPIGTWFRAIDCVVLMPSHLEGLYVPGSSNQVATATLAMSMAGQFRLRISEKVFADLASLSR